MSEEIQEEFVPPNISEDHQKAIDHVTKDIDLSNVSAHDVFVDIISRAKRFNFELMVACSLMEKVLIKENAESVKQNESEEQPKAE